MIAAPRLIISATSANASRSIELRRDPVSSDASFPDAQHFLACPACRSALVPGPGPIACDTPQACGPLACGNPDCRLHQQPFDSIDDRPVDLTRIQFDLLASLAEQPRRVLTREQLVDRVWGGWYGTDHHLDVHLSRLRQRITQALPP